jgi:hypothetical protein
MHNPVFHEVISLLLHGELSFVDNYLIYLKILKDWHILKRLFRRYAFNSDKFGSVNEASRRSPYVNELLTRH